MKRVYLYPAGGENKEYPNGGNEKYWMELIAVSLERRLAVAVPESPLEDGPEGQALRLALCSQTAPPEQEGRFKGPHACYLESSREGKRAAEIIAESLRKIYPEPELVGIAPDEEVSRWEAEGAPAVWVKLAYRDNPQDEAWLTNNLETIAQSLAQAAAEFLGFAVQED